MKKISPNILWPAIIVALLLANITVAVGTLAISKSNGGVQVVPDYYTRAVAWDSLAAVQENAVALGWESHVLASRDAQTITVTFENKDGQAIENIAAVVLVSQPQKSMPLGTFLLAPTDTPGTYRADSIQFDHRGLYDFSITAEVDGQLFVDRKRIEL